jgi:hypothetical protein
MHMPDESRREPLSGTLTIRPSQMEVFSAAAQRTWEDRMVAYIAHDFPNRYDEMGEAGARQLIRVAVRHGGEFGIDTRSSIAGLIELMIAFGEAFELSPDRAWARRMMANQDAPPDLRVHLMRERMMAISQGRVIVPHRPTPARG